MALRALISACLWNAACNPALCHVVVWFYQQALFAHQLCAMVEGLLRSSDITARDSVRTISPLM